MSQNCLFRGSDTSFFRGNNKAFYITGEVETNRKANKTAVVEHEATTSKISEDQLFYCNQRGIGPEEAVGLIVNGYAREVLAKLPMEFAVEAQKLLQVSLEGSVG